MWQTELNNHSRVDNGRRKRKARAKPKESEGNVTFSWHLARNVFITRPRATHCCASGRCTLHRKRQRWIAVINFFFSDAAIVSSSVSPAGRERFITCVLRGMKYAINRYPMKEGGEGGGEGFPSRPRERHERLQILRVAKFLDHLVPR